MYVAPEIIDVYDIKKYEDHINAQFKWLDFQKGRSYSEYLVAVRKIDEDRYVLVCRLNRYIIAKIFNKKLSAYVTDLTREEFAAEYEVKENI